MSERYWDDPEPPERSPRAATGASELELRAALRTAMHNYWSVRYGHQYDSDKTDRDTDELADMMLAALAASRSSEADSRRQDIDGRRVARANPGASECGCAVDSDWPSGVCPACHHREHGTSGCRAATSEVAG